MFAQAQPGFRPTHDLVAGVSVALVLIPQSLAYAELAGLPGRFGLYAAAFAPIAAAFLASSPYLQTGPVALTALLTFGALQPLAAVESSAWVGLAGLLALVVGVVRVGIGLARAGWISYLMSEPMMVGFTAGAGVLILASQIPGLLGVPRIEGGVLERAAAALVDPAAWDGGSLGIGLVTLITVFAARRIHERIPGVLIATVLGLAFSILTAYTGPRLGTLPATLPPFPPELPWARLPVLLLPGTVIALVGFAEAAAISQTYAARRRQAWDPNREFLSQGVANLASGLASGFPVGGSFSRTSLAFLAGAASRWSGLITGVAVLAFLPLSNVLAPLPRGVLAAIVIAAVAGLIDVKSLASLWRLSPVQALIGWSTFVATILVAPRIELAVLYGVGISIVVHVLRELSLDADVWRKEEDVHLAPRGVLWFGSAHQLDGRILEALREAPDVGRLTVHLDGLGRIDLSGALSLRRTLEQVKAADVDVLLVNPPPQAERVLGRVFRKPSWWGDSPPPRG